MIDIIAMNHTGKPLSSMVGTPQSVYSFVQEMLSNGAKEFRLQTTSGILHLGRQEVLKLLRLGGK